MRVGKCSETAPEIDADGLGRHFKNARLSFENWYTWDWNGGYFALGTGMPDLVLGRLKSRMSVWSVGDV